MIIGAQKCGTTTLHNVLNSHSDVFFPRYPQEIHFFDLEDEYAKGLPFYRELFDAHDGQAIVAQTSPLYMYLAEVPERIGAAIEHCKFIVILRDPVQRAYSHYWHEVRWGFEPLEIEEALAQEAARIRVGDYERRNFSYVDRGRYAAQIERFRKRFGADNLLVVFQDQLRKNPEALRRQCAEFLKIDPAGFADLDAGAKVLNPAMLPRSRRLQLLRPRLADRSRQLASALDRLNLKSGQYPPMTEATRQTLTGLFEGEAEKLKAVVADTQPDLTIPWA